MNVFKRTEQHHDTHHDMDEEECTLPTSIVASSNGYQAVSLGEKKVAIMQLPVNVYNDMKKSLAASTRYVKLFSVLLVMALALQLVYLWRFYGSPLQVIGLHAAQKEPVRNVIFMVSDGFGPASEHVNYGQGGLPPYDGSYPHQLPLDTIMVGQSRTRSSSSWVTDSAAGATAFSCADKSYNGAIAVNSSLIPCATVLEAAKMSGYHTGLVVTSRISHATPAAFSSHVTWRDYEAEIAVQQIGDNPLGRTVDLMFGGGRGFFLPNTAPNSRRKDARDLFAEAKAKFGFNTIALNRTAFDDMKSTKASLPAIGLFHDDHMSYNIDRDPTMEPSLAEMTAKALDILTDATQGADKGFFMMIEGSRIDMAAHDNDAPTHAYEALAYHDTIALVKQYVDAHPGTVMISVSDHETGGLALGRQLNQDYPEYKWKPEVVARVRNSTVATANMVLSAPLSERADFCRNVILPLVMGLDDYTEEDVSYLAYPTRKGGEITWYLGELVNRRAMLGWSTHGHTGVDVNLYAYSGQGQHARIIDPLRKNLENTELGVFVEKYLDLSASLMTQLTQLLIQGTKDGRLVMFPPGQPSRPELASIAGVFIEPEDEFEAKYHGAHIQA